MTLAKKFLFGLYCFLMLSIKVSAQLTPAELSKVITHSPNATSLGEYGKYNQSNGIPNIQIPLYTVKSGELEFPISVSYNAGGIKVNEMSSPIGLGWALNAGGAIIRVVRDKDDFGSYGFNTRYNSIPTVNEINGNLQTLNAELEYDKEPDIFIINAWGLSDKFCMDNEGNYVSLDFETLKYDVDYANDLIIVTDQNGTIYRFGKGLDGSAAYEETDEAYAMANSGNYSSNINIKTTWYLTEIISADGSETISFKYISYPYSSDVVSSVDRYTFIPNGQYGIVDYCQQVHAGINYSQRNTFISNARIIDKIYFKNGNILFSIINDREDMSSSGNPNDHARISGFTVYDNTNTAVKTIAFNNDDYFNRNASGPSVAPAETPSTYETKSLKLNGINYYDKYNYFIKSYDFEYDPTPLPPRNTTPQDLWGYYNGKSSIEFIPENFYADNSPGINTPVFIGTNRETDFNYMKAASLTKIIYPTGGYTTYNYEPNYYLTEEQQDNKIQKTRAINCYAMNRSPTCDPSVWAGLGPTTIYEFTVNEDLGAGINSVAASFSFHFSDYINYTTGYMEIEFYKVGSSVPHQIYIHTPDQRQNPITINEIFYLDKNSTYRIELRTNGVTGSVNGPCNSPFLEVNGSYSYWEASDPSLVEPKQAGGLRIKTISNYDTDDKLLTKKIYEYGTTSYGTNSIGVGWLISNPYHNFYWGKELYCNTDGCNQDLKDILHFTSQNQTALALNHGSPVDYEKVTEIIISNTANNTNGKIEYYYSKTGAVPEPKGSQYYPYDFYYYPDWMESVLLKTVVYKQIDDNTYEPLKSVINNYSSVPEKKINTLKVFEVEPDVWAWNVCDQLGFSDNPERFYYYDYFISAGRNRKMSELTTQYVDGTPSLTSKLLFSYNDQNQISKVESTNSLGEITTTVNKYPMDYSITGTPGNNEATGIKNLQDLHVISPIIEKYAQVKNADGSNIRTTGALFNIFKPTTPHIDQIWEYPKYKNNFTPATSNNIDVIKDGEYKEIISFDEYDSDGNLLQQHKIYDGAYSYIWDYSNAYPIAEVENANHADIAYTSFEADGKGNWDFSGPTSEFGGAITGSKSYSLSSGPIYKYSLNSSLKYTISYWSKGVVSIYGCSTINNTTGNTINGWTYHEVTVTGGTSVTINGSTYIDELRLYPEEAEMTSYAYEPLIGMTSQCDINNRITYYEYDGFGRLVLIKDADSKVIKKIDYEFKEPVTIIYYNLNESGNYTRDNCPAGYTPGTVYVSVPAQMFSSTISQADATNQALAYAQQQANQNATCTMPVYVDVEVNNNTSGTFWVQLINEQDNNVQFNFNVYPYAGRTQNLPAGDYTIQIVDIYSSGSYSFYAPCGYYGNGSSYTFYNITIDNGCKYINIYP